HPFTPFITEEIWHTITERKSEEALIVSSWPSEAYINQEIIEEFSFASEVIGGIRNIRKTRNISFKEKISVDFLNNENVKEELDPVIQKLGNVSTIQQVEKQVEGTLSFRVRSNEYFIPIKSIIDTDAEKRKLQEVLDYTRGFLKSVENKLSNERFVKNAPESVVSIEKAKQADALAKIEVLENSLASLN